jgi:hypothetical protein
MSSTVINKSHLRAFAEGVAMQRAHFQRKGGVRFGREFFEKADAAAKGWAINYINAFPSKGKTIK